MTTEFHSSVRNTVFHFPAQSQGLTQTLLPVTNSRWLLLPLCSFCPSVAWAEPFVIFLRLAHSTQPSGLNSCITSFRSVRIVRQCLGHSQTEGIILCSWLFLVTVPSSTTTLSIDACTDNICTDINFSCQTGAPLGDACLFISPVLFHVPAAGTKDLGKQVIIKCCAICTES